MVASTIEGAIFAQADEDLFRNPDQPQIYDTDVLAAAGRRRVRFYKGAIKGPDGEVIGLAGVITDIAEHKKITSEFESVARSPAEYTAAHKGAADLVFNLEVRSAQTQYVNTEARLLRVADGSVGIATNS